MPNVCNIKKYKYVKKSIMSTTKTRAKNVLEVTNGF